jgi:hypothetical protein
MLRWLWRVRLRADRRLFKGAVSAPPEIDPIEELSRIVGEAQERDATDELRFERQDQDHLAKRAPFGRDQFRPHSPFARRRMTSL